MVLATVALWRPRTRIPSPPETPTRRWRVLLVHAAALCGVHDRDFPFGEARADRGGQQFVVCAEAGRDRRDGARSVKFAGFRFLGGRLEYGDDEGVEIDAARVEVAKTLGGARGEVVDDFGPDLLFAAGKVEVQRSAWCAGLLKQLRNADAFVAARAKEVGRRDQHVFAS